MQSTSLAQSLVRAFGHDAYTQPAFDHSAHGTQAVDLDALAQHSSAGAGFLIEHLLNDAAVAQTDLGIVQCFFIGQFLMMGQSVVIGHDQYHAFMPVRHGLQALDFVAWTADPQISHVIAHGTRYRATGCLTQIDADIGMMLHEDSNILGQELLHGGGIGTEAHQPTYAPRIFAKVVTQVFDTQKNRARMREQQLSGRGRAHPAGMAQQQGSAGQGFQFGNTLADRRGDHAALLGRPRNTAVLADQHEQIQR